MKLGILSRKGSLYSTTRLREAAEDRGHDVSVIDFLRCSMGIEGKRRSILFRGEQIDVDAVIPRIGASVTFYGTAVVRQFETMGVYCLASASAISTSRDKLCAHQILARAGVDLPITAFARSVKDTSSVIEMVGGAPLVIKLHEGTQGNGVVLAETKKAAESVIDAFRQLDANILVQEFVKEARGSDVRCIVVGGRVVAAMLRHAAPGDFRSNLHRGGSAEPAKLTTKERRTAVKAAKALGLNVAGVDLLRSDRGPLVLEVNSSPGLEGIEAATGIDVAAEIIEFVENHADDE
ncbi:MAG: 30S ribosomal protein S6--L-glutamate ligase [Longimicrobiales bacterium]